MKNRKLLLIVSLALAMMMSLGGTLAYLTDSDGDVNVMTVGRVSIEQNEYERKSTVTTDETGNTTVTKTNELQEFTQGQQIVPAVHDRVDANGNAVDDPARTTNLLIGKYQYTYGIRNIPNYVDKLVTAKNTGNTNAYVRTLIAVPMSEKEYEVTPGVSEQWLHYNLISDTDTVPNNNWWQSVNKEYDQNNLNVYKKVEIKGKMYEVQIATNVKELTPGEETGPCMAGFYIDNSIDYDEDGYFHKKGDKKTYVWTDSKVEILVLTQAVQANGFSSAWEAFDNAFPLGTEPKKTLAGWFANMKSSPVVMTTNGTVTGAVTASGCDGAVYVKNGAKVTVNANVNAIEDQRYAMAVWATGEETEVTITGGEYTQTITGDETYDLIYASNGAKITITGGTFKAATPKWTLNCKDDTGSTITVKGGSFLNYDPSNSASENPATDFVAEGYKVEQTKDGNDTWYTVVPQ